MNLIKKLLFCFALFILSIGIWNIFYIQGERGENGKIKMIYIAKVIDEANDFWTQLLEGAYMAAMEYEVDLEVVAADKEDNYKAQNKLIEWAITQKPEVILLSPSSYTETIPAAEKIIEAGICLILIDSAMGKQLEESKIATDNIKAGFMEGEYLKSFIKEDSKIVIIGHVKGTSTAIERERGLRQALGEDEEKIVDVAFCDSEYEKAEQIMETMFAKHKDIDLVAGLNEYSAVGAARAVKKAGLSSQVRVVGFDSSLEEIRLLEEGVLQGIVVQKPFKMGYLGVKTGVMAFQGDKVPENIDSGFELITKDNMYAENIEELIFPFKED